MDLASVRALKEEVREKVLLPLLRDEVSRRGLGVRTRRIVLSTTPSSFALGIAKTGGDYKLAVRIQNSSLLGSKYLETIFELSRGQMDLRFIGHVRKLQIPKQQQRCRPLEIGCSIGHFRITAGTLAAFVKSGAGGGTMVLSNNHVLADENTGTPGDDIIQPGRFDNGQDPRDRVAVLSTYIPLDFSGKQNKVDCAVAALDKGINIDTGLGTAGKLKGSKNIVDPGDTVCKIGRTSGSTGGKITAIELDPLRVGYDHGEASFDKQIEVEGLGQRAFSQDGDSGSLVFDQNQLAVALVFAASDTGGSNGLGLTYANHISEVLGALHVDLIT